MKSQRLGEHFSERLKVFARGNAFEAAKRGKIGARSHLLKAFLHKTLTASDKKAVSKVPVQDRFEKRDLSLELLFHQLLGNFQAKLRIL